MTDVQANDDTLKPLEPLTAKGVRGATRVLQAATTVLARDGYGGATLGRIADEAGIDKRNILYYYKTRETLLVRVVQIVGEQIAGRIGAAPAGARDPQEIADATVDALWEGVTSVPELAHAYFALIGGGAGAPGVEKALQHLKQAYLAAIVNHLQTLDATRWQLRGEIDEAASFVLAILRGLLLEWVERGDPGELGLARFKEIVRAEFVAVP